MKHWVPLFFQMEKFQDIRLTYLLGVGIDRAQIENMTLDFLCIYIIAIYIYHYRNPILIKSVSKIFWRFPTSDNVKQWKRLEEETKKQVQFFHSLALNIREGPKRRRQPLYAPPDSDAPQGEISAELHSKKLTKEQEIEDKQFEFAQGYNKANQTSN